MTTDLPIWYPSHQRASSTVMAFHILCDYVKYNSLLLFEWSKCGVSGVSVVPTVLWAVGAAGLAHRLLVAVFRRFMFRRVPPWELLLQQLLFLWMVVYSLYFWAVLVKVLKYVVQCCFVVDGVVPTSDTASCGMVQQWIIWGCGAVPLALYIHTRPRMVPAPLMIWITTNPWHRREMGAYGYYLSRPLTLEPYRSPRQQVLRRAYSDSRTFVKEMPKKRRISKSV